MILVLCLAASRMAAAEPVDSAPAGGEVVPAPAPIASECDGDYGDANGLPQRTRPWWYWFHAFRGRQQHYPTPSPVPGSYYFRPYSLVQLRAQQEAVQAWGGDPRNPYGKPPKASNGIVKWPPVLLDRRFAEYRTLVESPYERNPHGISQPTNEDYQNIVGAAGRMKAALSQVSADYSANELNAAEQFLNRLAAQARSHNITVSGDASFMARQKASEGAALATGGKSRRESSPQAIAAQAIVAKPETSCAAIHWPAVLALPQFADQRAQIENPYQRSVEDVSCLTVEDYRKIIDAAAQMKTMVQRQGAGISPQECIDAERFLGRLASEARSQCVMQWGEQPDTAPARPSLAGANPYADGGVFLRLAQQSGESDAAPQNPVAASFEATPETEKPWCIDWPSALRDARFAELREKVEMPYRRDPQGQTACTVTDYHEMVAAATHMKALLARTPGDFPADERFAAEQFLGQLIDEATQRIQARSSGRDASSDREVIAWPSALRDGRFAEQRERIEAPYRQNTPEGSRRTAEDFADILDAAECLRAMLAQDAEGIPEQERTVADAFLGQLAAEARNKLQKVGPTSASKEAGPSSDEAKQAATSPTDAAVATPPAQPSSSGASGDSDFADVPSEPQ